MMLTSIALAKAVAIPIALAVLLAAVARRSANLWCLLAVFLSGILGAFSLNASIIRNLPAILPADQLQATTCGQAWLSGFAEAAVPEELSKGLWMLVFLVGWRRYAAEHGALIGGLVGLGFALRENLGYAQTAAEWRLMGAFSHAAWGVIMGSLFQRALAGSPRCVRRVVWAFIPPILLHGLLDTSVFLVELYESRTGLTPTGPQMNAALNPALLSAMLLTLVIELASLFWAIRLILARPRPSPVLKAAVSCQPS
jgi:RsiW-degrading membrane proteinase PrsW (M82 family)